MPHEAFFTIQAALALMTAVLLLISARHARLAKVTPGPIQFSMFLILVAVISVGNVFTSLATAHENIELRDFAGLSIRLILLTIAAYAAVIIPWRSGK